MYCPNCGKECKDDAKFCGNCGADLRLPQSADQPVQESPAAAPAGEEPSQNSPKRKKRWILWVIVIAAVCVVVIVLALWGRGGSQTRQYNNHMKTGFVCMEDGDYVEAVAEFTAAIEVDPQEIEPYRMLADAYTELGEEDLAEAAYDDAREVILTAYAEDTLPDGTQELYEDAITYYGEKGEIDEVSDLTEEITGMLTDEEAAETIRQISRRYIDGGGEEETEETEETEEAEETGETEESEPIQISVPPSEEDAEDLLETFAYWAEDMLSWCYTSNVGGGPEVLSDYETIDAADAYTVAALALREDNELTTWEIYLLSDGKFYILDEYNALSEDQKGTPSEYVLLSAPYYEMYLLNLFGEEYSLDDFAEYQDEVGETVLMDDDGQFYVRAGDYVNGGVEVAVAGISDTPDDDGFYAVNAEYTVHWEDNTSNTYYMQYRVAKDEGSEYGIRIVGMVPAGNGTLDPEFALPEPTADAGDAAAAPRSGDVGP